MAAPDITVDWLEPWQAVDPEPRAKPGRELQRESGHGHGLYHRPAGAETILVGETLMRSADPAPKAHELLE